MPKLITFKTPTVKGIRDEQGYIALLELEPGKRHKFVLQRDIEKPTILADYRTGYRLGSFAGMVLARYVHNPYAHTESISGTYRRIAQEFLDVILQANGVDKVREMLAKPPTLNP